MAAATDYLDALDEAQVDGVIVQDVGLAALIAEQRKKGRWGFELHISTQMTVSSPEGVRWGEAEFAPDQIVLARELCLEEIAACVAATSKPIEVFCHGALCVAYSGQCLTSESLGQRSANRGECAQACRLPYELVVDKRKKQMGERRYLFSPQDLCTLEQVPAMLKAGVRSFKIEGRLKSPEYVAAVTSAYRAALDGALNEQSLPEHLYAMQMTFSRGFYTGWLLGSKHPELTHGRFGKKRGALVGRIVAIHQGAIEIEGHPALPLNAGDGFVIDAGEDRNEEQGGRIWKVEKDEKNTLLHFHGKGSNIDWYRVEEGQLLWKTADPALDKMLRQAWSAAARHGFQGGGALEIHFSGKLGSPLVASCRGIVVKSEAPLQTAQKRPLTLETLQAQFARLGGTEFSLGNCTSALPEGLMIPLSQLNQMRRELVEALQAQAPAPAARRAPLRLSGRPLPKHTPANQIWMLCRRPDQALALAEQKGLAGLYLDFERLADYAPTVAQLRAIKPQLPIYLATLRIMKAGEENYLRRLLRCGPSGILVRNLGALQWLRENAPDMPLVGDFSLNMANALSADFWQNYGLKRAALCYDLNAEQVGQLLRSGCAPFCELTIHQHMPLFHMEHCVFCTFLSQGLNFEDCGQPCRHHEVEVRDRSGAHHLLKADEGCRNTLFNGQAQSAARHLESLRRMGMHQWRIELLEESPDIACELLRLYQQLLSQHLTPAQLFVRIRAEDQLGITKDAL